MRTRKTKRARRYLAAIAVTVLAAALFASFPLALVAAALTLAYVVARVAFVARVGALRLEAVREVAQSAIYADALVHVTLRAQGSVPLGLAIAIRDRLPEGWGVASGEAEASAAWGALPTTRYEARPAGRGSWRFDTVELRVREAYGLFEAEAELPAPLEIRVNASLASVRRGRAYAQKKPFHPRRKDPLGLIFREFEFEGIREYQGTDRLRDIDWKATTRMQEMMTKVFERELEGIVYCVVDASRTMREKPPGTELTMLDHAAELVLQAGEIASMRNFQLGLLAFDETGLVLDVPASRARGQERILAQRVLGLPGSLATKRRLDAAVPDERPLPEEAAFLSRVRGLRGVSTTEGALALAAHRRDAAPVEAAQRLLALHPPGSLFIFLLSDFASAPDETLRATKLLLDKRHKLAVGLLPDARYLHPPPSPTVRDVESAYRAEMARKKVRATLERSRALVEELRPRSTISDLVEDTE